MHNFAYAIKHSLNISINTQFIYQHVSILFNLKSCLQPGFRPNLAVKLKMQVLPFILMRVRVRDKKLNETQPFEETWPHVTLHWPITQSGDQTSSLNDVTIYCGFSLALCVHLTHQSVPLHAQLSQITAIVQLCYSIRQLQLSENTCQ